MYKFISNFYFLIIKCILLFIYIIKPLIKIINKQFDHFLHMIILILLVKLKKIIIIY